jgi:hypothetical protein
MQIFSSSSYYWLEKFNKEQDPGTLIDEDCEVLNEAADGHNSGHDVPPLHQQQKGIKFTTSCSSCPTTIQTFCKCSEEDAAQPLQQAPELALYMISSQLFIL